MKNNWWVSENKTSLINFDYVSNVYITEDIIYVTIGGDAEHVISVRGDNLVSLKRFLFGDKV